MAGFRPQRKFKFRVQLRPQSSKKPRRVTLVAQRKILSRGKLVTAGTAVTPGGFGQLNSIVAASSLKGKKVPSQNLRLKVGGKKRR